MMVSSFSLLLLISFDKLNNFSPVGLELPDCCSLMDDVQDILFPYFGSKYSVDSNILSSAKSPIPNSGPISGNKSLNSVANLRFSDSDKFDLCFCGVYIPSSLFSGSSIVDMNSSNIFSDGIFLLLVISFLNLLVFDDLLMFEIHDELVVLLLLFSCFDSSFDLHIIFSFVVFSLDDRLIFLLNNSLLLKLFVEIG